MPLVVIESLTRDRNNKAGSLNKPAFCYGQAIAGQCFKAHPY